MTFKKSEVTILLEPAKEIILKLGHKITSDWKSVKNNEYVHAGDVFADSLSIFCADPECHMRFDINQSNYGEDSYMLWHDCGCLAEMRIVRNNDSPSYLIDRMSMPRRRKSTENRFVCKKLKAML